MPVNTTHPDYDANLSAWLRARDVIAGEDAVKAGGEKYLPLLQEQTDDEYATYKARASFFNATARTAEGYVGLVFRRPPFLKLPGVAEVRDQKSEVRTSALGKAMAVFANDADMLGTPLAGYAKNVVSEVISVGRCGSLMDWEGDAENRAYVSLYAAENILNWRVERFNGRNLLTMVALAEKAEGRKQRSEVRSQEADDDEFEQNVVEQIRVLRLVDARSLRVAGPENLQPSTFNFQPACQVEIWQRVERKSKRDKTEWQKVETRIPLRFGKPLPLLPFVFHGPRHALPNVEKLPLADVIAVNLDHYRLDADYKHGMHFTALPTAWVSGFDKEDTLRIGSSTAWTTDTVGAAAGFLEYTGQGLTTFERAMDRDERLMAVLGARLLEGQKKVGETAESIELRQSGESSVLANIAGSVSASLTQVLRWACWWNSTEALPDDVTNEQVVMELNTDFSTTGLSATELTAVVKAWQSGALSRDTMLDLFRRGEILPEGRSNKEEIHLIGSDQKSAVPERSIALANPSGGNS
ncbi:MAG: DUF4055 domain-containing protein [Verrucomicrobia bacterium]|nr:DUF4055 domain-containing protein [Verrucomicrobiota bacterium]